MDHRFLSNTLKILPKALIISVCFAFCGCDGTETREAVDQPVEELSGQKNLEHYRQMKDDLGEIQKQQNDKYRQLDE